MFIDCFLVDKLLVNLLPIITAEINFNRCCDVSCVIFISNFLIWWVH